MVYVLSSKYYERAVLAYWKARENGPTQHTAESTVSVGNLEEPRVNIHGLT